jgi:hypothetical protein
MKPRRFTEVQIIGILKQAQAGMKIVDLCLVGSSFQLGKSNSVRATHLTKSSKMAKCEMCSPDTVMLHPDRYLSCIYR